MSQMQPFRESRQLCGSVPRFNSSMIYTLWRNYVPLSQRRHRLAVAIFHVTWKSIMKYMYRTQKLHAAARRYLLLARYVAKRSIYEISVRRSIVRTDRPATDRRPTSYVEKFKWPYLRKGSSDPLHV